MPVEFLEETAATPSGGVEFLDEEPIAVPEEPPVAEVEVPAQPPIALSPTPEDEFGGFEKLPEGDRARVMAQVELDRDAARQAMLEAQKAEAEGPLKPFGADTSLATISGRASKALGRYEKLRPRYDALTAEGARRLANERAAVEDERAKREYEASGKGPGFFDAGMAYLGSKLSNMASGVMSSIEPSFPALAEARQNLGEHGRQLQEFSSLNMGPAAAITRGGVDVGVMMTGNPAGFLRTIASIGMKSANEAYGATLAATGGDRGAAADASAKTYRDTLLYAAAGAATAKAANAMIPSTVTGIRRGLIGGGAAIGANVATSAGMAAAQGEDYGLQQFAADVLMGGVQGMQEARAFQPRTTQTDAQQNTIPASPDGGVRQPEVTPQDVPLSTVEGGERVPPSRPETAVEGIVPAIRVGGEVIPGERGETHQDIVNRVIQANPDRAADVMMDFDSKQNPNFFVDAEGREISRAEMEQQFGVRDSQGLRDLQQAEVERRLGPGAANIEEFGPQRQIAAYNAKVDEQRAARGLPPLMSEARRPIAEIWDKVEQRIEADPTLTDRLVKEANEDDRKAFTDEEQAAVLWKMTDLAGKLETENARIGDEGLDAGARLEAEAKAKFYEDQLADIETANRKAGTAWGRSGRTRQVIANTDFTLASLIGKARRAKGEPLTPEERAKLQEQSERYTEAEQKLRDIEEGETVRKLETEAAKDPAFTPEVRSLADRIVARLEEAAKGSSERIKALMSKLGSQLGTGADVGTGVLLVKELAVKAALEIGKLGIKTTQKFKRWAAKMISEFGEGISPYLKDGWTQADASIETAALGKGPRAVKDENPEQTKAQRALDAAMVERERMDMMLAGEIAPAKRQPREALTQLEEDARAEIQAMRGLAAEVRPKADPNTVRENAQVAALERAAAEYERRLNEADLGGRAGRQGPDTARVAKARALRDAARRAVEAARRVANPPRTKEQIALDNYKKMAARKTAEYEERTAKGDFGPRAKKPKLDISKDPEAVKAKAEMDRVRNEFERKKVEWERAQRSAARKLWDGVKETLAASRSLITSADVSAPFRQGGFLLLGDLVFNPRRAARQLGTMFKQMVSERGFEEAQAQLSLRPNAKNGLYDQAGLYLADLSTKLSAREESMRSNFAERIPIIGRIVRSSNRAYSGFLNRQRADAFDAMVESFGGADNITPEQVKALGDFVNTATGRGSELGMERAADVAARYFFSPRFLASRFQLATGTSFAGEARKVVAQQYAKFGVGLAAVYGLALLAGSKVEKDPRSADFGKARFGNTRIDPLSGLAQVTTFLARELTGKTKRGNIVEKKNRGDTFVRFVRTKLAPIPGVAADWMAEKTLDMQKPTVGGSLQRLTVPLGYSEIPSVYREHGAVRGTIMNALGLLGMGVQNYERKR
jgi:hypothetical protein